MKERFVIANVYMARWKRLVKEPKRISEMTVQIWGPTDAQTANGLSMEAIKRGERIAMAAGDEYIQPVLELLVNLGWPNNIYHWL